MGAMDLEDEDELGLRKDDERSSRCHLLISLRFLISSLSFSRMAMEGATLDCEERDCSPVTSVSFSFFFLRVLRLLFPYILNKYNDQWQWPWQYYI